LTDDKVVGAPRAAPVGQQDGGGRERGRKQAQSNLKPNTSQQLQRKQHHHFNKEHQSIPWNERVSGGVRRSHSRTGCASANKSHFSANAAT
jgi:hypothetical protein